MQQKCTACVLAVALWAYVVLPRRPHLTAEVARSVPSGAPSVTGKAPPSNPIVACVRTPSTGTGHSAAKQMERSAKSRRQAPPRRDPPSALISEACVLLTPYGGAASPHPCSHTHGTFSTTDAHFLPPLGRRRRSEHTVPTSPNSGFSPTSTPPRTSPADLETRSKNNMLSTLAISRIIHSCRRALFLVHVHLWPYRPRYSRIHRYLLPAHESKSLLLRGHPPRHSSPSTSVLSVAGHPGQGFRRHTPPHPPIPNTVVIRARPGI